MRITDFCFVFMNIPLHIAEFLLYLEPLPEGQPAEGVDDKFPLPEVCGL